MPTQQDTTDLASLVTTNVAGGVATITLNSERNRNALSARLRSELHAAVVAVLADDQARVVVLTHAGPVFCAGGDLKEAREAGIGSSADFTSVLDLLWSAHKPTIARLAGPARAGGIGLVAACDFAVAADSVTFAFTEVRIGVVPAIISAPLRHRVIGHALHRLFLTGETFDAARAVDLGLLSHSVSSETLDEQVASIVGDLLQAAPGALAVAKGLVRVGTLTAELDAMEELSHRCFESPEGREGVRAFVEKRKPAWVSDAR